MKNLPSRDALVNRHLQKLDLDSRSGHMDGATPIFENLKRCLSIADVASLTGLSTKTCEKLVRSGDIKAKRVGRRWVISALEYESWLSNK